MVIKARGTEGVTTLLVGVLASSVFVAGMAFQLVGSFVFPLLLNVLLASLGICGALFIYRTIRDVMNRTQWVFSANDERIAWLIRDRSGERSEFEIRISDVNALIYTPGTGDSSDFLTAELRNGSSVRCPLVGSPSEKRLLQFVNYWRENHGAVPIRNMDFAE